MFNELVRGSIMRGSGILLIIAAFVLGALGFWFWEQLAPRSSYSSGYSQRYNAGYSGYGGRYGGYRSGDGGYGYGSNGGYGGDSGYGQYGGYDGYGGYGYGGGTPGRTWGQPTYAVDAPYPRPQPRVAPPPCYSPCDDY
jgi:hypothetical protein